MHELSVASAVIDTATRHAAGRRVTVVELRVGGLRQVVPDSLAFYFEHVARGTLCAGARLEVEIVPTRLHCRTCEHEWGSTRSTFAAPYVSGRMSIRSRATSSKLPPSTS
jgi:hydrogenase nickel incorporation protein HypA/HybF